jgi:serine phosphatase RsbU (regulator of sigma subunit)/anti-sigma regulatory factor (Ser/Thr protein kinase)/anti-anti-sigma regulatory factor
VTSPDTDEAARRVGEADVVRAAFDALQLLVVATEGPELRVAAANAAVREYVGNRQLIGKPLREAFSEMQGQQAFELYAQVYATGEPLVQRELRVQIDLPEDRSFEMYVDISLDPWRWPDGTVRGVIAHHVDTTARVHERRAAQQRAAVAEQRYEEARDVIHALQRELLPVGVPVLPGAQVAASYLLAEAGTAAGGDWFDALPLPGDRIALVVGDVVGHGVTASATMGQLRILLEDRLTEAGDVCAALAAVERMAGRIRGAGAATVCVAALDLATGDVDLCTAGHPPPLVVTAGGEARYLAPTGGGPLGTGADFAAGHDRLEVGDLLLLYTDGIVERPGRDLAASTVELARVAGDVTADRAYREDGSSPVERVCTQTVEILTRITGHSDDITLLAAQRVPRVPPLELRLPATTTALAGLRESLSDWLARCYVGDADAQAIRHAAGELVTNAVEHGYGHVPGEAEGPGGPGTDVVTVTAELTPDGRIHVEVRDTGRWRDPAPAAHRGLGLAMITELVDRLHIDRGAEGTSAIFEHQLCRPARLLSGPGFSPTPQTWDQAEPFLILDQPSAPRPRIRVDGPVDGHSAPALYHGVRGATAGGVRSLTVDLTGVTHLASAGVAVLHRLAALHRANDTELRLYAPPGSPAAAIMSLVGLQHARRDPDVEATDPLDPVDAER